MRRRPFASKRGLSLVGVLAFMALAAFVLPLLISYNKRALSAKTVSIGSLLIDSYLDEVSMTLRQPVDCAPYLVGRLPDSVSQIRKSGDSLAVPGQTYLGYKLESVAVTLPAAAHIPSHRVYMAELDFEFRKHGGAVQQTITRSRPLLIALDEGGKIASCEIPTMTDQGISFLDLTCRLLHGSGKKYSPLKKQCR